MAATLWSISSTVSTGRSVRLPLGSPTMPVPPPTTTMGVPPVRCSQASAMTGEQVADVERVGGRVEADVAGDGPLGEPLRQARGQIVDEAARGEGFEQRGHGAGRLADSGPEGAPKRRDQAPLAGAGEGDAPRNPVPTT